MTSKPSAHHAEADWFAQCKELVGAMGVERLWPSISWGIVDGHGLVVTSSTGAVSGGEPPNADTVYRIASMTKSFTAAAVLSLRDEGVLRLDDDILEHAPELAGVIGPTTDNGPIRLHHLLSMASGLATDNPWADRHLDITDEELDAVAGDAPVFAVPTGTAFEYSNLGYGLLGRIVKRASGRPLQDIITERLLKPLKMTRTTWTKPEHSDWARPYVKEDGAFRADDIAPLGDGQFAPIGGLWSTVPDLARWMSWLDDANVPRDDSDDGPLQRASRREMQQMHRYSRLENVKGRTTAVGYGFGLAVADDPLHGRLISHAGGLPGYASDMRWIAGRGLGVVALANVTYAPVTTLTARLLDVVAASDLAPAPAAFTSPTVDRAGRQLLALLSDWENDAAAELFADNVALDQSLT
ncbi:MAG: serine hydrolase domain-containing protein, partial [Acidimicrobiales bacterium]